MNFNQLECPNCHKPYYEIFAVHTCDGNVPVCSSCGLESVFNAYHYALSHIKENMNKVHNLYSLIEQSESTQEPDNTEEQTEDM